MDYNEVLETLNQLGTEQNKKIYQRHGSDLEMSGVSIKNLKELAKRIKNDDVLSKQLFLSNNSDAIYLSIYLINPDLLTLDELESVINKTNYYMILENVVPHIAARRKDNFSVLQKWLKINNQKYLQVAYAMYTYMLGSIDDINFDTNNILYHINYIRDNIHHSANRTRYTMNNFIIQVAVNFKPLYKEAYKISIEIGKINVDMGETSCKVPLASEYITKIINMDKQGVKRKL